MSAALAAQAVALADGKSSAEATAAAEAAVAALIRLPSDPLDKVELYEQKHAARPHDGVAPEPGPAPKRKMGRKSKTAASAAMAAAAEPGEPDRVPRLPPANCEVLRQLLRMKGLPTGGKKADLVSAWRKLMPVRWMKAVPTQRVVLPPSQRRLPDADALGDRCQTAARAKRWNALQPLLLGRSVAVCLPQLGAKAAQLLAMPRVQPLRMRLALGLRPLQMIETVTLTTTMTTTVFLVIRKMVTLCSSCLRRFRSTSSTTSSRAFSVAVWQACCYEPHHEDPQDNRRHHCTLRPLYPRCPSARCEMGRNARLFRPRHQQR